MSLDAVVMVVAFMLLVVLGTKPFGLDGNESAGLVVAWIVIVLTLCVITFMKGRIALGAAVVLHPRSSVSGAPRASASPTRRGAGGATTAPSSRRRTSASRPTRAAHRWRDGFFNAIGGRPSEPDPPAGG